MLKFKYISHTSTKILLPCPLGKCPIKDFFLISPIIPKPGDTKGIGIKLVEGISNDHSKWKQESIEKLYGITPLLLNIYNNGFNGFYSNENYYI